MSKGLTYDDLARENFELKQKISKLEAKVQHISNSQIPIDSNHSYTVNTSDIVYKYSLSEKQYKYISPHIEKILGYSAEDFLNNKLLYRHIIHPDYFRVYKSIWKDVKKGLVPKHVELKLITQSGEIIWVIHKNLLIKNAQGEIDEIEGIISNISARKFAEEKLVESEAQKKAIINNLPQLAWLKSVDGIYLSVNDTFARSVELKTEDIIGKTDFEVYEFDVADKYRKEDRFVIKNKKQFSTEEITGDQYWETYKAPVFDNQGNVIGVTGVSFNITNRKNSEEEIRAYGEKLAVQNVKLKLVNDELSLAKNKAEEADRLKSAFLANMSHEIRTPMNAILGFATLLRDRKLSEDKKAEFVNLINANCRQLLHIITDIIDISKIEANQITLFKKDFNINKVLYVLKQNFISQITASKKDIKLIITPELDDAEAIVNTDKVRLEQILSNLLSNAIKFTEKGTIELGYKINRISKEIEFFVKDTGIGMTDKEQEVIFERFRQVSSAYNKLYGGTGLGLSICKGLVDKLEGNIWVNSEVEEGSTFHVSLPFTHGQTPAVEPIAYNKLYTWQGKTILIAEDEKTNYSLLENIILPTKAKVIWVKNGIDAIEACKNNSNIDLVLMDIKMPDMNGLEATKRIKKFREELPIIAQTAFAMPQDADNCLRAGCDDYLAKPLGIDDILNKINKYINASGKGSDTMIKNTQKDSEKIIPN
ncbi:MAG: response regulator [Bacteroidales bacterium]|nr:response regulator [Bacteroidales bacterium]MBN2819387.1 response regulator [Bacteroidales bacterium]